VESADVTASGFAQALQDHFPNEVVGVSDGSRIAIYLAEGVSPERERQILEAARLLMACDVQNFSVSWHRLGPVGKMAGLFCNRTIRHAFA